jgi:adenylosuccinate lyase
MSISTLTAISPIDGRYRNKVDELGNYFSELGLIKYRVLVEIEYFIALCESSIPQLADFEEKLYIDLRDIYKDFNSNDARLSIF